MQINKLVFIAHGWCLGLYDKALINEPVEAWKFGPVIASLYHKLKPFKGNPVTETLEPAPMDEDVLLLLEKVWKEYGNLTGGQLSSLTHKPGSPWYVVWEGMGGKDFTFRDAKIPDDVLKAHYKSLTE